MCVGVCQLVGHNNDCQRLSVYSQKASYNTDHLPIKLDVTTIWKNIRICLVNAEDILLDLRNVSQQLSLSGQISKFLAEPDSTFQPVGVLATACRPISSGNELLRERLQPLCDHAQRSYVMRP